MMIRWGCGPRGIWWTLEFRPPSCIPASRFLRLLPPQSLGSRSKQGRSWRVPVLAWLTQPVSAGGPGRERPPEAAAGRAAAEDRPAGQRLRPGQGGGPPGAGGGRRQGQGPAPQQPAAEEEQAAGEHALWAAWGRCWPRRTPPFPGRQPRSDRSPSTCTVRPCAPPT